MGLSTQGNKPELLARLQQARGRTITRPTPAARARPSASPASAQRQPAARASSRPVPVPPVEELSAQELLGELTSRGLATTGTAAVLRARLQRHYEAEARRQSGATGFEEQIGAFEARLPRSASQASAELPRTASQATARSLFSPGSVSSNESFSSAATHRSPAQAAAAALESSDEEDDEQEDNRPAATPPHPRCDTEAKLSRRVTTGN